MEGVQEAERDLKDYLLVGAAAPHPLQYAVSCVGCKHGLSICRGLCKCPAASSQLCPRPLLLAVLCLLQEARRAVGGGVKVQYVSLNKDSHVLEVPEVRPGVGGRGRGDRAWGV